MFKPIKDYEHLYQINENGDVYSNTSKRLIKPYINKSGYLMIALSKNSKAKHLLVSRLVASHFIENPENKAQVNHKDCNKLNNHISNLEWVTHQENIRHAVDKGKYVQSEERRALAGNWFRKKVAQVDGGGKVINVFDSEIEACNHFGVHKGTISRYIKGLRKNKEFQFKYLEETK